MQCQRSLVETAAISVDDLYHFDHLFLVAKVGKFPHVLCLHCATASDHPPSDQIRYKASTRHHTFANLVSIQHDELPSIPTPHWNKALLMYWSPPVRFLSISSCDWICGSPHARIVSKHHAWTRTV